MAEEFRGQTDLVAMRIRAMCHMGSPLKIPPMDLVIEMRRRRVWRVIEVTPEGALLPSWLMTLEKAVKIVNKAAEIFPYLHNVIQIDMKAVNDRISDSGS